MARIHALAPVVLEGVRFMAIGEAADDAERLGRGAPYFEPISRAFDLCPCVDKRLEGEVKTAF